MCCCWWCWEEAAAAAAMVVEWWWSGGGDCGASATYSGGITGVDVKSRWFHDVLPTANFDFLWTTSTSAAMLEMISAQCRLRHNVNTHQDHTPPPSSSNRHYPRHRHYQFMSLKSSSLSSITPTVCLISIKQQAAATRWSS